MAMDESSNFKVVLPSNVSLNPHPPPVLILFLLDQLPFLGLLVFNDLEHYSYLQLSHLAR